MEYLRDRLIRETVRFLEMCQQYFFEEKISFWDYTCMTGAKLDFISDVLESEKHTFYLQKDTRLRLERIYSNNQLIYGFSREAVGK